MSEEKQATGFKCFVCGKLECEVREDAVTMFTFCDSCLKKLRDILNGQQLSVSVESVPHRCPVCGGNGLVPNGFYRQTSGNWVTTDATPEQCKSCNGIGIVR